MPVDDLIGHVLDGRYKVLEVISEGAMGVVYRGERTKLGRAVAIKVMRDELPDELASRKRFEVEAMAMAKLEHPNCVSVLDVGLHEGKPYVVMDFVSGTNLREILDRGKVEIGRAAEIMRQVLSGLAHAHELGIMHRDIKPANIMLSAKTGIGEQARLLDFGLARPLDGRSNLTGTMVLGTPAYMAPEQCRGGTIDARTDVYACGVMLFELLSGKKPFHSAKDDPIEVVQMQMDRPPPRLDDAAPGIDFGELEAVVARALAKAPEARYQSAVELAQAIEVAAAPWKQVSGPTPVPVATSGSTRTAAPPPEPAPAKKKGKKDAATARGVAASSAPAAAPRTRAASSSGARDVEVAAATAVPSKPARDVESVRTAAPAGAARDVEAGDVAAGAAPDGAPRESSTPAAELSWSMPRPDGESPAVAESPPAEPSPVPEGADGFVITPNPAPRSRRNLYLIGGGIALVLVIAFAATRKSGDKTPTAQPNASPSIADAAPAMASAFQADAAAPVPPLPEEDGPQKAMHEARDLIADGKPDAALAAVNKARKEYYANPDLPYLAGRIYFSRHAYKEQMAAFKDAIRLDDSFRANPELVQMIVDAFAATPERNAQIAAFLHDELGSAAVPLLERAGHEATNPSVKARITAELARYKK